MEFEKNQVMMVTSGTDKPQIKKFFIDGVEIKTPISVVVNTHDPATNGATVMVLFAADVFQETEK